MTACHRCLFDMGAHITRHQIRRQHLAAGCAGAKPRPRIHHHLLTGFYPVEGRIDSPLLVKEIALRHQGLTALIHDSGIRLPRPKLTRYSLPQSSLAQSSLAKTHAILTCKWHRLKRHRPDKGG